MDAGREMPRIPELRDLYAKGVKPRHGEVIMIAGRSGSQKSGLALWLTAQWNLPTLYFSADMSPFTASARLASMATGLTTEQVEIAMLGGGAGRRECLDALADSNIRFAFGSLSWQAVDEELEAYVEVYDAYPGVVVFDNLMDFEGAEADYTVQMAVMSNATALARETGATTILLHHASDKSWDAKSAPFEPPSRQEVKGGLSEKPELSLTVALDPDNLDYRIACVKQRMGPSDPTAKKYSTLRCQPELTRFHVREWQA
jgi:hypothetical protein